MLDPGRLRALLTTACLVPVLARAGSPDDAQVFARIDALRPVAAAVVVDGDCADWGAIPLLADPAGDAAGDASRDVTGLSIAPLDDALLVRIELAGVPPPGAQDVWIEIDYRRQQFWDLKLSLDAGFAFVDFFPESGEGDAGRVAWGGAQLATVGSCVEARIPHAALEALLPEVMRGQLSGAGGRSWLRVRATTGEPLDFLATEIDHGPAAGSFRLAATPYALDPPLPPGSGSPFETALPLHGEWYLGQGSHGVGTHQGIPWAWDWHRVDGSLLPESPQRSPDAADSFSAGHPLHAPAAGTIFSLENDEPDCPPYAGCGGSQANFVFLEVPGDRGVLLSHTLQGSIPWQPADPVAAGALLGRVGNSGSGFSFAHLHHEVRDTSELPHVAVTVALSGVEVGLNPGLDDDPWMRAFESWVPREGFVARRRAVPVPLLPLASPVPASPGQRARAADIR